MLLRQLFSVSVVEELCSFYLEAGFFKPMVNRLEIYSWRRNVSRNCGLRSQAKRNQNLSLPSQAKRKQKLWAKEPRTI